MTFLKKRALERAEVHPPLLRVWSTSFYVTASCCRWRPKITQGMSYEFTQLGMYIIHGFTNICVGIYVYMYIYIYIYIYYYYYYHYYYYCYHYYYYHYYYYYIFCVQQVLDFRHPTCCRWLFCLTYHYFGAAVTQTKTLSLCMCIYNMCACMVFSCIPYIGLHIYDYI